MVMNDESRESMELIMGEVWFLGLGG